MKLILGTMTFGQQVFLDEAQRMADDFVNAGYDEFDTAYVYNEGRCEEIVGQIVKQIGRDKVKIATKVNPRITGRLDGQAVETQLNESLARMNVSGVETLYLHFPDYNTPIDSALEMCARLYEQGKFTELGLSNFPAWLVADVYYKCKTKGYMLPKVYEGLYNAFGRKAETELFDALKAFEMRFYAYNPLAGGILSGKYDKYEGQPTEGRFTFRPNYQKRYWKKSYFDALEVVRSECEKEGITVAEAAIRWLAFHSQLNSWSNNGIIIGASKEVQLKQNIETCSKGALTDNIVFAFNEGWKICAKDAPEYFRYYGK